MNATDGDQEPVDEQTRTEWREFGFHLEPVPESRSYRAMGSRSGLLKFVQLLRDYVADPRNAMLSEHEHYTPYGWVEVMTWDRPGMDDHAIFGTLDDLGRLAGLVETAVTGMRPGSRLCIREEYSPDCEYALVLEMRDDDFDPASEDQLPGVSNSSAACGEVPDQAVDSVMGEEDR